MGRKAVNGYQGRSGRVTIDGTEVCVTNWSIDYSGDEEDVTNSCSNGWADREIGIREITGSVEADWDVDISPFATAPGPAIDVGDIINLKLFIHAGNVTDDVPFWQFNAKVTKFSMSSPARGKVTYSFDFGSIGAVALPTADASG